MSDPFSTLFAEFEAELKLASPNLDGYLEKLRQDIAATPELVWKLTPEQIGLIVSGLAKVSRIEIASASAGKTKKKDLDALGGMLDLMSLENGPGLAKSPEKKAMSLDLFGGLGGDFKSVSVKVPPWKKS